MSHLPASAKTPKVKKSKLSSSGNKKTGNKQKIDVNLKARRARNSNLIKLASKTAITFKSGNGFEEKEFFFEQSGLL